MKLKKEVQKIFFSVIIFTKDRPQLFLDLISIFTAEKISIHQARIFTLADETVIDTFTISLNLNKTLIYSKKYLNELKQKLSFENVGSVYLQLGDDTEKLQQAIFQIKRITPLADIWISILIPTPQKLSSLNFRPWQGVKFSQQFLHDIDFARNKNLELKQLAKDLNCNILFS